MYKLLWAERERESKCKKQIFFIEFLSYIFINNINNQKHNNNNVADMVWGWLSVIDWTVECMQVHTM